MAFPTTQITTTNLDSDTDNPALARVDLLDAVTKLNTIIDEANSADGVVVLSSSGKILSNQVPNTVTATGTQILNPTSGVVQIENIIRLTPQTTTALEALTPTEGDVAYCSDGDSSNPCLAVYNGTDWLRVSLGTAIDQYADSAGA